MPLFRAVQRFRSRKERHKLREKKVHSADGLRTNNKNLEALFKPRFLAAWNTAKEANRKGWPGRCSGYSLALTHSRLGRP